MMLKCSRIWGSHEERRKGRRVSEQEKRTMALPSSSSTTNDDEPAQILVVEWQWRTDNLRWRSYSSACSAAIEAARSGGESSVEISVDGGSSPTHSVCFHGEGLSQMNLMTHRKRKIRRRIGKQSSTVIWEWWEEERNKWHQYNDQLATEFETAWIDCSVSRSSDEQDCLAGMFFELNGQTYSLLFESDALQYNLKTSFCRSVRRRAYLSSQILSRQPLDMGQSQASNGSAVSRGQLTGNESEQNCKPHYGCSDLIDCLNPGEDENCSICLCRLQDDKAIELVKCHHFFHRECIAQWFKTRPSCPECLTVYGVITGAQPPGNMSIQYIPVTSQEAENGLEGYPGIDIIKITYRFPNGIQTAEHPTPGRPYTGTTRVAYLPKNREGEEVLELLKTAWNRRLLFTVGTSVTTGKNDTVVWAGIHHKTQKRGGSSNYGYPDETYFDRVKKELADVNVM